MRDPHVNSLTFQLKTDGSVVFEKAGPISFATKEFKGQLVDNKLVIIVLENYPSEEAARSAVEPYLRSWEINTLLDGRYGLQFVFAGSEVVDRNPVPSGERQIVEAHAHSSSIATASATGVIVRSTYPLPPALFSRSPLVVGMVDRLKQYTGGGESLFSAAYYCLTAIEKSVSDIQGSRRKNAATKYRIDIEVLKQLGELSSEKGGPLEARKAGRVPPTGRERDWLETALRRVIRHVATVEGGDDVALLTMTDLPPIAS